MRIRSVAVSLLAAFTLTGCNMLPIGIGKSENAANIEIVKVSADEYIKRIDSLNMNLNNALDNLIEEADLHTKEKGRTKEIAGILKEIQNVVKEYRSLQPPEEYTDVQEIFIDAMDSYDEMLGAMRKTLRKQDKELWENAKEPLEKAEVSLDKANTELQERIAQVEDEGDKADAPKEPDEKSGIDYEAVEKNISASGIELVGNWGPEDSTPSIVLHADGIYEGYKNGEYPSYDNAIFGTWKYDKSRHTILIKIDEIFADGVKKENATQNTMELRVQKLQDDKILLVDNISNVEFHYIKYDDDFLNSELPSNSTSPSDELDAEDESATEDKSDYEALIQSKWTREDDVWTEFIQFYDLGTVIVTRFNNQTRESTSWYGNFTFNHEKGNIAIAVIESNEPSVNVDEISFTLKSVSDEKLELLWNNETLIYEVNKPFKVDEKLDGDNEIL